MRTDGVVDGSCPAFASALDGTVAMDDGSTWARTEQGCFTVQDDHFRGEGTFVLGAPDGSTVTGTFLSVADLPTDGVPYGLDVTGGTGAYAGVTGRCTVTVAIDGGPLQQTQTGELTCTLVVPAPASASSGGASATVPEAA